MQIQRYTNNTGVPLSMAVWLATDEYDYVDDPFYLSVTTFIKSPRQIILGMRAAKGAPTSVDVASRMASAIGSAVHNSIEQAWKNNYRGALAMLGYPQKVIDRIRINPSLEEVTADETIIPIYMELRALRKIGKYTIGGKFDFVGDGKVEDFKTTGTYSYTSGSNEWKYKLQGSLYRWLNPEIITGAFMNIQFIFGDWKAFEVKAKAAQGYPATQIFPHKITLTSVAEMEVWVQQKIALLESLEDAPEADLPLCGPNDLWQDKSTYKYYKNPAKTSGRSTNNFDTSAEATIKWIEQGRVGVIKEVPGGVKGCSYCDAFHLCSQKDTLIANGQLK